jgi:hypothetical protein
VQHHATMTYGGGWSASHSGRFIPDTLSAGGSVGLIASVDAVSKIKAASFNCSLPIAVKLKAN